MSRNLERGASRRLAATGEPVVVRNYTRDGNADDYGDEERVERADSPYETTGVVAESGADSNRDAGASRPAAQFEVYLDANDAATDALAGGPDDAPRSTVEAGGRTLGVRYAYEQANGLVKCVAEVIA